MAHQPADVGAQSAAASSHAPRDESNERRNITAACLPDAGTPLPEAARRYVELGLAIVPCAGKRPLVPWEGRGSTTAADAAAWWRRWPDAGVALLMGPRRLLALDVDGSAGEATREAAERLLGPLPPTLESVTRRGRHMLFAVPEDVGAEDVRRVAKSVAHMRVEDVGGRPRFVVAESTGLDLRAGDLDAGRSIIVAPPSIHASGWRYRWKPGSGPIAPLPAAWWSALPRKAEDGPRAVVDVADVPAAGQSEGRLRAWFDRVSDLELGAVQTAPVGARNCQLRDSALRVFRVALTAGVALSMVAEALVGAAVCVGLDQREAVSTVRSALRAAKRYGAAIPPRDRPPPRRARVERLVDAADLDAAWAPAEAGR